MSEAHNLAVIEWATDEVRVFDPITGNVTKGRTIAEAASAFRGQKVILTLSRRSSFVRCIRLPDVPRAEMERILALQLSGLFPIEGADAAVDFLPLEDRNGEGRLVLVAAVRTDVLREALSEADRAGVKVHAVWPVALASNQFGVVQGAVVGPTLEGFAIDVVSKGGVVLSRVVPMPADATTAQAEISRSLAAANLTGGSVTTFGKFDLPEATNTHSEPLSLLTRAGFDMNLELPEKKQARSMMQTRRVRSMAILLWAAAILVAVTVLNFRLEAAQDFAKAEASWTKRLKEVRAINAKTRAVESQLKAQQDLLERAFSPKQPLGDVLTVLTNLAPAKLWLTGMTVERGKRATLRGTAMSSEAVSSYLASLGRQSRVRDVKLVFANNALIETTPVVNFSLSAHVVGNYPLGSETGGSK